MSKRDPSTPGIPFDDAVTEIGVLVDDATDFKASEMEGQWSLAERYYNGYTDLEEYEGRSVVTKTEVRDAIRNSLPSIMRTLLQSRKPVVYQPTSALHGMWVEQQAEFVTQLFYKNDGYMQLYQAIQEALKYKMGVLKAWHEVDPQSQFFKFTKIPLTTLDQMLDDPDITVEDYEVVDTTEIDGSEVDLYDVSGTRDHENGRIVIEAVPNSEFFISRNCFDIPNALAQGVHGQSQIVTVSEAMDMGLEYDDWLDLDAEDPELRDHTTSSTEKRGYQKDSPNDPDSMDVLKHEFKLTEAYVKYDLKDEGRPQVYRFYLGGTSHKYIAHEQVEDSPFSLIKPIPIEFSSYGHSLPDFTIPEQDASTSLLRGAIDNTHASNGARFIGDPTKINFDDFNNQAINAPVRARMGAQVQTVQVPFSAPGVLEVLKYLDLDVQSKVGVTKAAQGLDPDAMQSTDKNAVMNTIATSQGQTELMVRNIIETGLIRVFKILLRLSVQHFAPRQMLMTKGKVIPIDQRMFDVNAVAQPNVGLGTGSPMQRQSVLTMIYGEQKQYMEQFGPNNPFTSFSQIYNTLEDMLEANGVYNTERYFNMVTPAVEEEWAKQQEEQRKEMMRMQQEQQPMDPSKAFLQVEQGKRENEKLKLITEHDKSERDMRFKATDRAEHYDLERDRLTQDRVIEFGKLGQKADEAKIKKEQANNDGNVKRLSSGDTGGSASSDGKS